MSTAIEPATERELRHGRERIAMAPILGFNFRDATASGDGSWIIEGYAAVFEQETTLWDAGSYRMREVISRGAFSDVLGRSPLVHLNFGHDMNTSVAATNVASGIGSLHLSEDTHGLRFVARVDPADPDAVRLAAKMRRGVVSQASFAFTIESESCVEVTQADGSCDELYRIESVRDLFDVCACAQGAYPQTESALRSLSAAYLGRSPSCEGHLGRSLEGPEQIAPLDEVGPQSPIASEASARLASTRRREVEIAVALHTRGLTP